MISPWHPYGEDLLATVREPCVWPTLGQAWEDWREACDGQHQIDDEWKALGYHQHAVSAMKIHQAFLIRRKRATAFQRPSTFLEPTDS